MSKEISKTDKFYTVQEASVVLKISQVHVRRLIHSGKIQAKIIGYGKGERVRYRIPAKEIFRTD